MYSARRSGDTAGFSPAVQKSTRITMRRSVGRLTSVKPASANTSSVPTWSSVVGLVLRATRPGDAVVAQQTPVGGARLDRAPADRLTVEVRDEAAGRARLWMAAVGLLAQPVGAFFGGKRGKRLPRPHLVPLALASGRLAAVPKTVCKSSQLASLAGTTEIAGSVAVMRTILQVEWATGTCWPATARAGSPSGSPARPAR